MNHPSSCMIRGGVYVRASLRATLRLGLQRRTRDGRSKGSWFGLLTASLAPPALMACASTSQRPPSLTCPAPRPVSPLHSEGPAAATTTTPSKPRIPLDVVLQKLWKTGQIYMLAGEKDRLVCEKRRVNLTAGYTTGEEALRNKPSLTFSLVGGPEVVRPAFVPCAGPYTKTPSK